MNDQQFKVRHLTTFEEVMEFWPFILEGLGPLNEVAHGTEITAETLFKVVLSTATLADGEGLVLIISSKNDKPLLWAVVMNSTAAYNPRTCVVYAVYSNKKAPTVVRYGLEYTESWARKHKYTAIKAFSPCMNGSRFRLFEHVWRFKREAVVFRKDL